MESFSWEEIEQQEQERLSHRRVNVENGCIVIRMPNQGAYEVDLDRCKSAAACLDWIHQVSSKIGSEQIISDFLEVLFESIPVDFWSGKA